MDCRQIVNTQGESSVLNIIEKSCSAAHTFYWPCSGTQREPLSRPLRIDLKTACDKPCRVVPLWSHRLHDGEHINMNNQNKNGHVNMEINWALVNFHKTVIVTTGGKKREKEWNLHFDVDAHGSLWRVPAADYTEAQALLSRPFLVRDRVDDEWCER